MALLQSGVLRATKLNEATGVPSINRDWLSRICLNSAKIELQHRIAEILSTLDEAIEATEALIAKHQQIKAGLMHALFTRGVNPDGHLRPTREQAPDLYKESPLGWIPQDWEIASLFDRGKPGRSHLRTGPFGSSLKIEHWVKQGHPVITIGALAEGSIIESELLFVSDATARALIDYKLEPGDVVFSRVADVGRSVAITECQSGWIMSSNLMRISLDQAKGLTLFTFNPNSVTIKISALRSELPLTLADVTLRTARRSTGFCSLGLNRRSSCACSSALRLLRVHGRAKLRIKKILRSANSA